MSPAKSLDYETPLPTKKHTKAALLDSAQELIAQLKGLAPEQVSSLMGISEKLGELNFSRYQEWSLPFSASNARQAILAFKGDVYVGIDAYQYSEKDFEFAQEHLRILSGLYGVLRPLDRMQAYRLEMGTKLATSRGKTLYDFWGTAITDELNKQLERLGSDVLINLASNEYFKSVKPSLLKATIINPIFKDWKNGKYKIISFFAKKARGRMSSYIIQNQLTSPEEIKAYDWDGYQFDDGQSSATDYVFTRKQ